MRWMSVLGTALVLLVLGAPAGSLAQDVPDTIVDVVLDHAQGLGLSKLAELRHVAADPATLFVVPVAARGSAPSRGHSGGHASHHSSGHHSSHHGHFHSHIWIGAPLWWDPWWAYPAPVSPVVVEPPVYVQKSPAYWYYCPSLQAYYPYVASCPEPWVPVPAQ